MVIQREMFPGETNNQMSYAHKEKESFCNDNFCVNQNSSSMQMVRPSPCMPNTHHHHHVAGIHHDGHHLIPHESHHSHDHRDYRHYSTKEDRCDEKRHHGKEKGHTNARVSEFVKEEAIKICSDKLQRSGGYGGGETHHHHHASRPVVAEPYYYKQETAKYSGGPNGRMHYFEYKGLED